MGEAAITDMEALMSEKPPVRKIEKAMDQAHRFLSCMSDGNIAMLPLRAFPGKISNKGGSINTDKFGCVDQPQPGS